MANTLIGRLTPTNNMGGTLTNESRLTGQLGGVGAVVTYASLPDKPSINNVELVGNKTTSDLNISYNDLRDQPVIPDVGEIDERLDDLEGDITSLSGRVTTAEGNITSLGGRVTTAEGNITTLQGDTSALDTRLTTAEGDITSLGGRLTTAEGNITSLDGRVTTNEGDISDLQDDMTQAQSDITQLNSSKSNLLTVDTILQTVGTVTAGSIKDFTIDVAKSGYTPLGVIGFNIGAGGGCGMVSIRLGGSNTVSVRIRNNGTSTSSDNTDCRVYILYLKNND